VFFCDYVYSLFALLTAINNFSIAAVQTTRDSAIATLDISLYSARRARCWAIGTLLANFPTAAEIGAEDESEE